MQNNEPRVSKLNALFAMKPGALRRGDEKPLATVHSHYKGGLPETKDYPVLLVGNYSLLL